MDSGRRMTLYAALVGGGAFAVFALLLSSGSCVDSRAGVFGAAAASGTLVGVTAFKLFSASPLQSEVRPDAVGGGQCGSCDSVLSADWRLCPFCGKVRGD